MKKILFNRILAMLVIFIACGLAGQSKIFYQLDHFFAEQRMAMHNLPASGEIVLLEIDNKSLTEIGLWPWKRSIYGEIVEKSFAAGANEIAFDIDFSASSSPQEDAAFQRALEEAEGPVTLAIFQQHSTANREKSTIQTNRPIAALEDSAWLATVNVLADDDGVIRHYPLAQVIDQEIYPSLTSVLGGMQDIVASTFIVDYGINPNTIPTYSIIDLLNGDLPADALQGRKVLVGAGAAELRDTLTVPVHGMMSGPKLQILAAENIIQGRNLKYAPAIWQIMMSFVIFFPIIALGLTKRLNTFLKLSAFGAISVAIELMGFWIYETRPFLLATGLIQAQLVAAGSVLVLTEFRFKDLLLTLSRKRTESITALLQTVVSDSFSGILIVGESGEIFDISEQAKIMLSNLGYKIDKGDNFRDQMPPELVEKLSQGFNQETTNASQAGLQTLELNHRGEELFFEYSITPSRVTSEEDPDEGEGKVVTLLFHDVTEARRETMRLEYLSEHDQTTDLLNLRGFCSEVDAFLTDVTAPDPVIFACQVTRIDKIGQSLGSEFADLLLLQIGQRFEALGSFDRIGITDQGEFLLFKAGTEPDSISKLATVIRETIEQPHSVRGHNIIVSCQIGVADFNQAGILAQEVAKAATVALHRTEETGDAYLVYTSDLAADVLHRRVLEQEIIDAIDRDEFELHYQPQVNLKNGHIIGCEALIRWNHRDLGMIRPDLFIPIVEETGMIVELGRWILETACRDAMQWPHPVTVAVNVSAVQFARSDILKDIKDALKETGLPKERLHIEITESLFITDPDTIVETLTAIREFGVKIALDDFGTGYSSLSYIHQFPLDKIKIDRAFVKDLPLSMSSMAVINAVVALARGFDMDIVAEGMETEPQAEILRLAGCHIGQGFYFGKPMPHEAFSSILQQQSAPSSPAITWAAS